MCVQHIYLSQFMFQINISIVTQVLMSTSVFFFNITTIQAQAVKTHLSHHPSANAFPTFVPQHYSQPFSFPLFFFSLHWINTVSILYHLCAFRIDNWVFLLAESHTCIGFPEGQPRSIFSTASTAAAETLGVDGTADQCKPKSKPPSHSFIASTFAFFSRLYANEPYAGHKTSPG